MGFAHLAEGNKMRQNDMLQNLAVVANDLATLERGWGYPEEETREGRILGTHAGEARVKEALYQLTSRGLTSNSESFKVAQW